MADEMTRTEFAEYMQAFEERLNQRMDVQFDETRSLIRLSLEAVETLRESTARGFTELRAELGEQTSLLKDAIRHVRGRVERVERRK